MEHLKKYQIHLILILIVAIIGLCYFLNRANYKYKEIVGKYDIYALISIEEELDSFIRSFNNNYEDTPDNIKLFQGLKSKTKTAVEFLERSPNLNFLPEQLNKLFILEGNNKIEPKIVVMQKLQKGIKTLIKDKITTNEANSGIVTYDYFHNKKNREAFLKEYLGVSGQQ